MTPTYTTLHIGQTNVLGEVIWFSAKADCGLCRAFGQFPATGDEGYSDDFLVKGQFAFQRQGPFVSGQEILFDISEIDGVPVATNLRPA